MYAPGEIPKRLCEQLPLTRKECHFISQNVLSKAEPQMTACIGRFKLVGSPYGRTTHQGGGCSTTKHLRPLPKSYFTSLFSKCLGRHSQPFVLGTIMTSHVMRALACFLRLRDTVCSLIFKLPLSLLAGTS